MKKSANTINSKTKSQIKQPDTATARQLKYPEYKTLQLSKRIPHKDGKIANAFTIFKRSLMPFRKQWKLFLGITVIYVVLSVVLVKGFSTTSNLADVKTAIGDIFGSDITVITKASTLFSVLMSTAGTSSGDVASIYQSILLVLMSLIYVWALRMTAAGHSWRVKDAFYKSTYPLVPFILVIAVGMLQMIPAAIGGFLANVAYVGGIAVTPIEEVLWALLVFLFFLWSLYMLVSTVMALYIVTLPDMGPLQALRTARNLVMFRRWTILRKFIFMPVLLIIGMVVIMTPTLLFLTPVAEWIYLVLTVSSLGLVHSYFYNLYRELL